MLLADHQRIEQDRGRGDRVDRRIHALRRHAARQHDHAVDMRGDGGDGGVGEVVGRHVDRLDRGDGGLADRGDALLQRGDLVGQRRLVADPRRRAAEQPRHLGARLDEAEHVVHQQEHVLLAHVAEIFGDRHRGHRHAPARARRLVHLPVDERGARRARPNSVMSSSISCPSRDRSPTPAKTEMPL